jgi:hypothetical protein
MAAKKRIEGAPAFNFVNAIKIAWKAARNANRAAYLAEEKFEEISRDQPLKDEDNSYIDYAKFDVGRFWKYALLVTEMACLKSMLISAGLPEQVPLAMHYMLKEKLNPQGKTGLAHGS